MNTEALIEHAMQSRIALDRAYEIIAGIDTTGRNYAIAPYRAYLANDFNVAALLADAAKHGLTVRKIITTSEA